MPPQRSRSRPKPAFPPRVPIRAVREAYGLSAADVADRMAEQGYEITAGAIRDFETANQWPSSGAVIAWAKALKLNPVDVVVAPRTNGNGGAA
jgi:transcriptional regulator with XRE-family HTH domain